MAYSTLYQCRSWYTAKQLSYVQTNNTTPIKDDYDHGEIAAKRSSNYFFFVILTLDHKNRKKIKSYNLTAANGEMDSGDELDFEQTEAENFSWIKNMLLKND